MGNSRAWDLFVELRKELVELQKIRAQVIGFKIMFVSGGIGLVGANIDKVPHLLFSVPAFAAMSFDLLIHSYSFSIKRTGCYCRSYLEPALRHELPQPMWEEFMASEASGTNVSFWGNLGITFLSVALAAATALMPFRTVAILILMSMALLLAYDIWALYKPRRFAHVLPPV